MNLFKKINVEFSDIDLSKLIGKNVFSHVTFHEYSILDNQYLAEYLKDKIHFKIRPDVGNITKISSPGAGPHIDTWGVALNFYITANNDETHFWEEINSPGKNYGAEFKLFKKDTLKLTESVTFKQGECILLNTKCIHSVGVCDSNDRIILRFGWKTKSFDEIYNSLVLI